MPDRRYKRNQETIPKPEFDEIFFEIVDSGQFVDKGNFGMSKQMPFEVRSMSRTYEGNGIHMTTQNLKDVIANFVKTKFGNKGFIYENNLTRIVRWVIKENEAPERYVIDYETGEIVGTHKYGVGFVVNKIGERMGYESHPTSIPNGTKMEKSDHELEKERNYRNELGMDRDDFSSLRDRKEDYYDEEDF